MGWGTSDVLALGSGLGVPAWHWNIGLFPALFGDLDIKDPKFLVYASLEMAVRSDPGNSERVDGYAASRRRAITKTAHQPT